MTVSTWLCQHDCVNMTVSTWLCKRDCVNVTVSTWLCHDRVMSLATWLCQHICVKPTVSTRLYRGCVKMTAVTVSPAMYHPPTSVSPNHDTGAMWSLCITQDTFRHVLDTCLLIGSHRLGTALPYAGRYAAILQVMHHMHGRILNYHWKMFLKGESNNYIQSLRTYMVYIYINLYTYCVRCVCVCVCADVPVI